MVEVIVEYDYTAKESDELTIKKGDIIKDVVQKQGGWWQGLLKDKRGMFPDNFVRLLDSNSSVALRNKKDVSRIRQCRVVFSYSQDHEDELDLNIGDIIDIIGEEEEGWWRGTLNGKEGVFPSNFVEEIVPHPEPTIREDLNSTNSIDTKVPALPVKALKQLCEAKYPYKAQNEDELTLKEGDVITLISKESQDPGWWRGELNGKIGVFPDNFVTLLPEQDGSKEEKKISRIVTDTGAIKPSSIASQRKSLETKPPTVNHKPLSETKTTEHSSASILAKSPPVPSKKPIVSLKKSPSGSSGSSGIFSEIRKKLADAVDGAAGSKGTKVEKEEVKDENAFDQVERRQLLTDVRATRAKGPGRRPPSSFHKEDEFPIPNGNAEHIDSSEMHHNTSSDSGKSRHKDWDRSNTPLDVSDGEKPKLREWEKHKAPWLEEMKLNQAKRSSTSPGRDAALGLTPVETPSDALSSEETVNDKEADSVTSPSRLSAVSTSPSDTTPVASTGIYLKSKEGNVAVRFKPSVAAAAVHRQSAPSVVEKESGVVGHRPLHKEPKPLAPSPPRAVSAVAAPPAAQPIQGVSATPLSPAAAQRSSTNSSTHPVASPEAVARGDASGHNHSDILERLQRLERTVERQERAIEELRHRLQVETDMRMMLQEKVLSVQNVNV